MRQNFTPHKEQRDRKTSFIVKGDNKLFEFVLSKMGGMSKTAVKSLLSKKQISVNDKIITQYDYPLTEGDKVEIDFVKRKALQSAKLSILYEDNYIIVVNKSEGLLTTATDKQEDTTAFRIIMNHLKQQDKNNHLYIVHRLDRETSGVLIFAKDKETQKKLQENWHDIVLEKIYYALVEGVVQEESGTIHSWLKEEPKSKNVYSFDYDNGGMESFTDYKIVRTFQNHTLLEVNLRTGRKNQIRVHLQSIGHPIVGDKKYGGSVSPIGRIGLHAARITLRHPATNKIVTFEALVPEKIMKFREQRPLKDK
ncbi:MAG: RluA family pseudouridine synthase [Paludibacteraceae bacterium]|nr:RluA family pseudouridine synthase [Paludibacteraceae bacterium]